MYHDLHKLTDNFGIFDLILKTEIVKWHDYSKVWPEISNQLHQWNSSIT